MRIGLVRRGYSPSGGAERYLKRFGEALVRAGHEAVLFASPCWPTADWAHGKMVAVSGDSPAEFAAKLARLKPKNECDLLYSMERVHSCDCFRAGDGVHKAWLARRAAYDSRWRAKLRSSNRKHVEILALEEDLMAKGGAGKIIVNSEMVRHEIVEHYRYPEDRIHTVYNGVSVRSFERAKGTRKRLREDLLAPEHELLVLFAGSGWKRKGLAFAIDAVKKLASGGIRCRLLVAGRGRRWAYRSRHVVFLGEISSLQPWYEAADVFILPTIYDPFSNACLEAMINGLPVVTTSANGFHEVLTPPEDGWVVQLPHDTESLAQGLLYWADEERRREARPIITTRGTELSIERNVQATLNILLDNQS